jgi:hypothetical protein
MKTPLKYEEILTIKQIVNELQQLAHRVVLTRASDVSEHERSIGLCVAAK